MVTRQNKILIGVGAVILLIIGIGLYLQQESVSDPIVSCIAENSVLYVSKTCGHCAQQKKILGDTSDFTMIDCLESPSVCAEANVTSVPTWDINGKRYEGVQSLAQLQEYTGCNG